MLCKSSGKICFSIICLINYEMSWGSPYWSYNLKFFSGVYENNGYLTISANGGLNQMRAGVSTLLLLHPFLPHAASPSFGITSFLACSRPLWVPAESLALIWLCYTDLWHGCNCKIFERHACGSWIGQYLPLAW